MVDQQGQDPVEGTGRGRFENFGKRVDERVSQGLPKVEDEVKKVIAFLNDQVVPRLRQDSSQALHAAADRLRKLAEQLDGNGAR